MDFFKKINEQNTANFKRICLDMISQECPQICSFYFAFLEITIYNYGQGPSFFFFFPPKLKDLWYQEDR